MDLTKKQKIGLVTGGSILLLLMILAVYWSFFRGAPADENLPSLIDAARPQYNYNDDSYIRENVELYLAQLTPLLGNLENAVQEGNVERIHAASTILERGIVRWRDALDDPSLIASVERYVAALTRLREAASQGNPAVMQQALAQLSEIKTLVIETQRSTLWRMAQ